MENHFGEEGCCLTCVKAVRCPLFKCKCSDCTLFDGEGRPRHCGYQPELKIGQARIA